MAFGGAPNTYSNQRAPGGPPRGLPGLANGGSVHPGRTGIPYGTMGIPTLPPAPRVGRETVPGAGHHVPLPAGAVATPGGDIHLRGTHIAPPGQTNPAPGSSSTPGPQPPAGQPPQLPQLDSTALANIASNLFRTNNDVNALGLQGGYADTDLQSALGKLAYQQPRDELAAEQGANRRGALFSSAYDQQLGDLIHGYQSQQGQLGINYQRGVDERAAKVSALQGGIPLYDEGQAAASATRAALLAEKNPAIGEPNPTGGAASGGAAHPGDAILGGLGSGSVRGRLISSVAHAGGERAPGKRPPMPAGAGGAFGSRYTRGQAQHVTTSSRRSPIALGTTYQRRS